MSDDLAKIVLGDTAVSAIESRPRGLFRSRKKDDVHILTHCENCGAELHGHWCGTCGQPAVDYRRSFRHIIGDLLEEFLSWDSKFLATLWWLLVRPWRLTNEFRAGHRVRYVHPLRIYLLASVSFFFAATYGIKQAKIDPFNFSPENRAEVLKQVEGDKVAPELRAKIQQALTPQPLPPDKRAKLEKALQVPGLDDEDRTQLENQINRGALPPHARETLEQAMKDLPPDVRANVEQSLRRNSGVVFDNGKDENDAVGKWFQRRAKEKFGEHGSNLQLFFVTLASNLPYMMLACVPLFALVLKILYVRKRVFYIDHLVYAFHIHSFAYITIMLLVLATIGATRFVPQPFAGLFIAVMWSAFAVQIFLSIRRVYQQGWFFSIFKFLLGGAVYLIVLLTALAATFLVTLALPS